MYLVYQGGVPTGGLAQHEYEFYVYRNGRLTYQSSAFTFKGTKYPTYFSRIVSSVFPNNLDKLKGYEYDIRKILLEDSVKDAKVETPAFITCTDAKPGEMTYVNPCGELNLQQPQTCSISVGNTQGVMRVNFV